MKRLILIQNDFGGAGKTTLARSFQHYLDQHQVSHLAVRVTETANDTCEDVHELGLDELLQGALTPFMRASDLVLLEVESGLADAALEYFGSSSFLETLAKGKVELMVATPVTDDVESFDGVTAAARCFADNAQYLVIHTPTGSDYDGNTELWEQSRAARIMDLLDGVDLHMPAIPSPLKAELQSIDLELAEALPYSWVEVTLQNDLSRWLHQMAIQFDATRKYLFGEAFRPAISVAPMRALNARSRPRKKASRPLQALTVG